MAGLVAGRSLQGAAATALGLAPAARILPVRVVADSPNAAVADQAAAIDVAVSTGATVLALGAMVDVRAQPVAAALANATKHNAVAVASAATSAGDVPRSGVLRVGGVGIDGRLAVTYFAGAVDVVAPGEDVMSVGITGTGDFRGSGTQYAVAFAAGQVALVRAMFPDKPPTWVVERMKQTASPIGGVAAPDPQYGWGLIDPDRATAPLPTAIATAPAPGDSRPIPVSAAVVAAVIVAVIALLLVLRIRRAIRAGVVDGDRPVGPGAADPSDPSGPARPPGGAGGVAEIRAKPVVAAPSAAHKRSAAGLAPEEEAQPDTSRPALARSAADPQPARAPVGTRSVEEPGDAELGVRSSYGTLS
jgi:membrane-anchored mycosin MYCP